MQLGLEGAPGLTVDPLDAEPAKHSMELRDHHLHALNDLLGLGAGMLDGELEVVEDGEGGDDGGGLPVELQLGELLAAALLKVAEIVRGVAVGIPVADRLLLGALAGVLQGVVLALEPVQALSEPLVGRLEPDDLGAEGLALLHRLVPRPLQLREATLQLRAARGPCLLGAALLLDARLWVHFWQADLDIQLHGRLCVAGIQCDLPGGDGLDGRDSLCEEVLNG